ncbi:MAG TPA: amidohydrolase family protein, partial [Acidimicrobiia bacterium]|nr:amidohydrolase family protein [Acidimicrobiia bacterium]
IPIFLTVGVPGPRVPFAPQRVETLDIVCYEFPDLVVVMRHGAEPWADLAVKLMLKWPGLHYSTSAFAPKYYPREIIEFANTRGADKVLFAGYFPMGLSYETIFAQLARVPLRDHVWDPFLYANARRVLHLDA